MVKSAVEMLQHFLVFHKSRILNCLHQIIKIESNSIHRQKNIELNKINQKTHSNSHTINVPVYFTRKKKKLTIGRYNTVTQMHVIYSHTPHRVINPSIYKINAYSPSQKAHIYLIRSFYYYFSSNQKSNTLNDWHWRVKESLRDMT